MRLLWSTCLLSFVLSSSATLHTSFSQIQTENYDFIIIGGGTAGSVLASRLSENQSHKVLIIEAGVDNANVQDIIVPFLGPGAFGSLVDWNFTSTPQVGAFNRTIPLSRGFVLGGSSSINFMTWNRGSNDVWDNFARLTNDSGWSWDSVSQYYLKTSRLTPPSDGHNTTGEVIPSAHGNGSVETSLPGFPTALDPLVTNTAKELGGRFPYNEDFNAGNMIGFGFVQNAIGFSERSSAATAYLVPILNRTNLDVVIHTRVTKLYSTAKTTVGLPVINTVEIAQSATGPRRNVTACKEVILSAGVFGTPQILMLSGIGPQAELQKHNIPVLVNSPNVGQHLTDHPLVPNYYVVNDSTTFDNVLRNSSLAAQWLQQWNSNKTGLFVLPAAGNTAAFLKNPSGFFGGLDPSSGPLSGNNEIIFSNGFAALGAISQPATGNFMTVITAVVSPTSRGTLTLNSTDPFDSPLIDPQILTTDYDIQSMVQIMKDSATFISSPLWKDYVIQPFIPNLTTDDAMATFARNNSVTVNHCVGTARMGPAGIENGVVDSQLRVQGVSGLRIVDASVYPQIPENHPQAVAYTLAERASDLIKAAFPN